jgi:hypothetical protein
MNNIHTKTTKDRFFTTSDEVVSILSKLACLKCWTLYFILTSKQTFKNGLVGVFEELSFYDIAKLLSSAIGSEVDITTAKHFISKLEKNNLVRIINKKPLIAILQKSEFAEDLKTINEVLDYVQKNEQEFNFHIQHRRATEFFTQFNRPRLPMAAHQVQPDSKSQALDTLIRSRPTRAVLTAQEVAAAEDWAKAIDEDEKDPFEQHIKRNSIFILEDDNYEKYT